MNVGRSSLRIAAFVVHNWPLKLAAIILATLLYAGLVASENSGTYPGPLQVTAVNQPSDTVVTNQLRPLEQVRYIAPAEVGRLTAGDFRATVDLSAVDPTGEPVSVRVNVVPTDPRVTVFEVRPESITVVLDRRVRAVVPVRVARGPVAVGIDAGTTVFSPETATVTGPSAAVERVVAVRVNVALDPGGINFDRDVEANPIDAAGEVVHGVNVEPRTIHVTVPLFTNRESRTLPVNPVVTGAPAPGFRIAGIAADPLVISVEGDAEELNQLVQADTAPVAVFGATRDVTATVALALPTGVVPLGVTTVTVVVRVEPVTETRTFTAGFRLDGRNPELRYDLAGTSVLLTLFGSVADLDRLAAAPLVVGVNVAGLDPGIHELPVVPAIPSGVTVAALAPETVTVTITDPAIPVSPSAAPPSVAP
ncbi:MAG: CdaR family protein [Chloroflexota bacterium]|nr:CdaR family protein [Chloroflexota bacterium]